MRRLFLGLLSSAAAVAALAFLPDRSEGQEPDAAPPTPGELNQALREAERAHLKRVGIWGLANTAAGVAVALSTSRDEDPGRHGFGLQTAGWGIINTGIAAAGLAFSGRGEPPGTPAEALAAESRWGQILVLNEGLNVGYMMVGGALIVASERGLNRGEEVRGHAWAVVVQGLGLFVLDGVAWLGHRERMQGFGELLDRAEVAAVPVKGGGVLWGVRLPFGPRGEERPGR